MAVRISGRLFFKFFHCIVNNNSYLALWLVSVLPLFPLNLLLLNGGYMRLKGEISFNNLTI